MASQNEDTTAPVDNDASDRNTVARTVDGLAAGCYTAAQLQHGTAEHLHITSRRCFIGPIPDAWLSRHRKSWYHYRPSFARYSSRTASFLAAANVTNVTSVTGLEGMTGAFKQSFPQPQDVDEPLVEAQAEQEEEEGQIEDDTQQPANLRPLMPERTHTAASASIAQTVPIESRQSSFTRAEVPARPKTTASMKVKHTKDGSSSSSSWWKRSTPKEERPAFSRKVSSKSVGSSSFVTAAESLDDEHADNEYQALDSAGNEVEPKTGPSQDKGPSARSSMQVSPEITRNSASVKSTAGLLDNAGDAGGALEAPEPASSSGAVLPKPAPSLADDTRARKGVLKRPGTSFTAATEDQGLASAQTPQEQLDSLKPLVPTATNLVHFNEPAPKTARFAEEIDDAQDLQKRSLKTSLRRRSTLKTGQLVKADRMLVRVDSTVHDLGDDFDENNYFAKEAKQVNKWREFVVVCRQSSDDEAEFVLRMYKSRVIPLIEDKRTSKKYLHEIVLRKREVHVNFFSTLDKTIVLWAPWKKHTRMYILKPQSLSDAVQWYHFLRTCLGWKRPPKLNVHVPDLDVTLTLDNPFLRRGKVPGVRTDDSRFDSELHDEGGVARAIILQCLEVLANSALRNTTDIWQEHGDRMGLAWRRYDRLEWISGVNEENMFGSMAMQVSHELEMLPKRHYPTCSKKHVHSKRTLEEPPAVEGFLVRMTSQKGRHKRAGKDFFKKLYFYTNDHLLCFCQPSKAVPPKPPALHQEHDGDTPTVKDIAGQIPLIYGVNPYPLKDGRIAWLDKSDDQKSEFDRQAYEEAERRTNILLECEAYINMTHIAKVRKSKGEIPVPETAPVANSQDPDSDVEDEEIVDEHDNEANQDTEADEEESDAQSRSFELVLQNGLVVRLQAYSKVARKEWVRRLRELIKYWKSRKREDSQLLKTVRHENLERLQVDEEMEAIIGQYARKWEVRRSVASGDIWNMCNIASCRSMSLYGVLFRKPRPRGTFKRCNVILAHGKLLVFQSTLRSANGAILPHIYHERQEVIDLEDLYIYSGLITDGDLLYQNQTFSPDNPGHTATPRVYLEDGWTSSDEDTMTCFCLWSGSRKSFFRGISASDDGRIRSSLRYVRSLGVPGRTIVFKARSRAERDKWVLSIGLEIERIKAGKLSRASDIRITGTMEKNSAKA